MFSDPFLLMALVTAGLSALVLLWYLVRKPMLGRATKVALLFGIGILPVAAATNRHVARLLTDRIGAGPFNLTREAKVDFLQEHEQPKAGAPVASRPLRSSG